MINQNTIWYCTFQTFSWQKELQISNYEQYEAVRNFALRSLNKNTFLIIPSFFHETENDGEGSRCARKRWSKQVPHQNQVCIQERSNKCNFVNTQKMGWGKLCWKNVNESQMTIQETVRPMSDWCSESVNGVPTEWEGEETKNEQEGVLYKLLYLWSCNLANTTLFSKLFLRGFGEVNHSRKRRYGSIPQRN